MDENKIFLFSENIDVFRKLYIHEVAYINLFKEISATNLFKDFRCTSLHFSSQIQCNITKQSVKITSTRQLLRKKLRIIGETEITYERD